MTSSADRVSLDLLEPATVRRRARGAAMVAVVVAAVFGGLFGFLGGPAAGLVAAAVAGLPLLALACAESRRRIWLDGGVLTARAVGSRRVDLARLDALDVLVTDIRGVRSVSVLVRSGRRAITIAVAMYTAAGGRELGVLALRRLADALAGGGHPRAGTVSALLVAQLRAEARGEALGRRPLRLAAGLVPEGRVVRTVAPARLEALVAELA